MIYTHIYNIYIHVHIYIICIEKIHGRKIYTLVWMKIYCIYFADMCFNKNFLSLIYIICIYTKITQ